MFLWKYNTIEKASDPASGSVKQYEENSYIKKNKI